jgi:uncharacterized protein
MQPLLLKRRWPCVSVDGDQLKLCFEEILALEHEADSIARDVLLGLRTTFITPFDRDDIQSLITSMDDSVDQCKRAVQHVRFDG